MDELDLEKAFSQGPYRSPGRASEETRVEKLLRLLKHAPIDELVHRVHPTEYIHSILWKLPTGDRLTISSEYITVQDKNDETSCGYSIMSEEKMRVYKEQIAEIYRLLSDRIRSGIIDRCNDHIEKSCRE